MNTLSLPTCRLLDPWGKNASPSSFNSISAMLDRIVECKLPAQDKSICTRRYISNTLEVQIQWITEFSVVVHHGKLGMLCPVFDVV